MSKPADGPPISAEILDWKGYPELLTTAQAAEMLGIKPGTLRKRRMHRQRPYAIGVCNVLRYPKAEIIALIEGRPTPIAQPKPQRREEDGEEKSKTRCQNDRRAPGDAGGGRVRVVGPSGQGSSMGPDGDLIRQDWECSDQNGDHDAGGEEVATCLHELRIEDTESVRNAWSVLLEEYRYGTDTIAKFLHSQRWEPIREVGRRDARKLARAFGVDFSEIEDQRRTARQCALARGAPDAYMQELEVFYESLVRLHRSAGIPSGCDGWKPARAKLAATVRPCVWWSDRTPEEQDAWIVEGMCERRLKNIRRAIKTVETEARRICRGLGDGKR